MNTKEEIRDYLQKNRWVPASEPWPDPDSVPNYWRDPWLHDKFNLDGAYKMQAALDSGNMQRRECPECNYRDYGPQRQVNLCHFCAARARKRRPANLKAIATIKPVVQEEVAAWLEELMAAQGLSPSKVVAKIIEAAYQQAQRDTG